MPFLLILHQHCLAEILILLTLLIFLLSLALSGKVGNTDYVFISVSI